MLLNILIFTFIFGLFCCLLYFHLLPVDQHTSSIKQHMKIKAQTFVKEVTATWPDLSVPDVPSTNTIISILLQQSPVQQFNQLLRIENIDQTWAQWASVTNAQHTIVNIVAAVLSSDINAMTSLSFVDQIPMFVGSKININNKDTSVDSYTPSPFHNMLRSFAAILTDRTPSYRSTDWLVFANDHTFILPHNLAAFLNSLDSSSLVYTGSRLAIHLTKDNTVSFASGGAGAVLSHGTAKLLLLVWIALGPESTVVDGLLESLPAIALSARHKTLSTRYPQLIEANRTCQSVHDLIVTKHMGGEASRSSIVLDTTSPAAELRCVLQQAREWFLDDSLRLVKLVVRLSGSAAVELSRDTSAPPSQQRDKQGTAANAAQHNTLHKIKSLTIALKTSITINETASGSSSRRELVTEVSGSQLQKHCFAKDKWSHINPGIVLASCLQNAFRIPFTPSTSHNVYTSGEYGSGSGSSEEIKLEAGERFNCYDPLRLLTGEVDDWYKDGKALAVTLTNQATNNTAPPLLAREIVSFHYVDMVEARLLYSALEEIRTFNKADRARDDTDGTTAAGITTSRSSIMSVEKMQALVSAQWPRNQGEAGVYARPLRAKNAMGEARLIAEYLLRGIDQH